MGGLGWTCEAKRETAAEVRATIRVVKTFVEIAAVLLLMGVFGGVRQVFRLKRHEDNVQRRLDDRELDARKHQDQ
jgi:hypothetical protein